jgi:hypothetical protein
MKKIIDPVKITKYTSEELLEIKENLELAISTATEDIVGIKMELTERLKKMDLKSDKIGKWLLTRYIDTRFQTTLDQARELGATKVTEKVDSSQLKKIVKAGGKVPGVVEGERLRIAVIEDNEEI